MRKIHLLMPTILVASSIPMVSMVGCGNKNPEPTGTYHTIKFENVGGSIPDETVKEGDKAVRPQDPKQDNKKFDGWYSDAEFGSPYTFTDPVKSDFTLYAKWSAEPGPVEYFTVEFMDGETSLFTETVKGGDPAIRPQDPTKSGHVFENWYDNSSLSGDPYDFNEFITSDGLILYAKWNEYIPVEGVTITTKNIESWTNEQTHQKVQWKVSPDNATDPSITWTVGDSTVATVDEDGTITPLSNGTTTIIVRTNDGGFIDTCNLLVTTKAEEIHITQGDNATAYLGYKRQLTCKITPETATKKDVEWKSSETSVATIDNNGWVTPAAEGTTTITVKTKDGSGVADSCTLTVKQKTPLCFKKHPGSTETATIEYEELGGSLDIDIEVSKDEGENWNDWDGQSITLADKDILFVRNTKPLLSTKQNYFQFHMTGEIDASGDVDSMINYSSLTPYCYTNMFEQCWSLLSAPDLPSASLAEGCYKFMFSDCEGLTQAPELPATTLADYCYYYMFTVCQKLKVGQDTGSNFLCDFTNVDLTPDNRVKNMFAQTAGSFKNTPEPGHAYYWYT